MKKPNKLGTDEDLIVTLQLLAIMALHVVMVITLFYFHGEIK